MIDGFEINFEAVEALAGYVGGSHLQQHLLEKLFLCFALKIAQAVLEPLEAEVAVEGDGARVGHQRLPDLLASTPR